MRKPAINTFDPTFIEVPIVHVNCNLNGKDFFGSIFGGVGSPYPTPRKVIDRPSGEATRRHEINVMQNPKILETVALFLRIKSVMLAPEDALRFLERAHEIDPDGHVPDEEEISVILADFGI